MRKGDCIGERVDAGPPGLAAWSVLVLALLACRGAPGAAPAPATPLPAPAASEDRMSETNALFTAPDGRKSSFRVEVADTPDRRERGLMHRAALDADRGMVFVFPSDDVQTFWMKNTLIPLDMVFVEASGRVAGVVEDARPLTLDPRSVGTRSRYVVELNSRVAKSKGIGPGATVVFEPALKPVRR